MGNRISALKAPQIRTDMKIRKKYLREKNSLKFEVEDTQNLVSSIWNQIQEYQINFQKSHLLNDKIKLVEVKNAHSNHGGDD